MNRLFSVAVGAITFPFVVLGSLSIQPPQTNLDPSVPQPVVPHAEDQLRKPMNKLLANFLKNNRKEREIHKRYQGLFKMPVTDKGLSSPWEGMKELEAHGLGLAKTGYEVDDSLALLERLNGMLGRSAKAEKQKTQPVGKTTDECVRHLEATLDQAGKLHEEALKKFTLRDRRFLFDWPAPLLSRFGPQVKVTDGNRQLLQNDRAFCGLVVTRYDWPKVLGSAEVLLSLASKERLKVIRQVFAGVQPLKEKVPGCSGDILFHKRTEQGHIIIAGAGINRYQLKEPTALLIDLGGDDIYEGTIASSADAKHVHGVVIDLAGNDTYNPGQFGLACGRAGGVGLLADLGGDDTYELAIASGGTGFGGIGLLYDADGKDTYTGSKYTQGAALAGLGVLVDAGGDDRYTSHGYALGFGGPAGAGLVLDHSGDDVYQCGRKYASGYNVTDAPNAKPDDLAFQYDAFGMGMGLGRRIISPGQEYASAGGLGVVIDKAGNDTSTSSNFSQACGYYFGTGLKLDLSGDDQHGAARYGHASGAHFGMGLFVDYAGKDIYTSTGPTYNCGCAWDHSVFLCVDGGKEDDGYQLTKSNGLGRADIGSWGVFADLGGNDRYQTKGSLGNVTRKSVAVFFDANGKDDYGKMGAVMNRKVGNGIQEVVGQGGMFVDR